MLEIAHPTTTAETKRFGKCEIPIAFIRRQSKDSKAKYDGLELDILADGAGEQKKPGQRKQRQHLQGVTAYQNSNNPVQVKAVRLPKC
ncbi:unnamed protein product [Gongylonema pulchrum]|uniref:Transposase n=1 Tax=Gongylonema pulchrum TaxID=637853 RepID=A0A183DFA7_9BILA|nr:unnamed protein product [Gongylonema pulchrum]